MSRPAQRGRTPRPVGPRAAVPGASSMMDTRAVAEQLHSAAIHLLRRLRRHDSATGVSGPRLSALSVVVFGGPITLGDLAAAEQVRAPTMTRVVQALERQGHVRRTQDPKDRRVFRLAATPRGRRLLLEGRNRRVDALALRLDALNDAELSALGVGVTILETVARSLD